MATVAKEGEKKDFQKVSSGTVQAVCYDVWQLGWQRSEYKGEKIVAEKIVVGWEVNEPIEKGDFAGKRLTINKFYTLSLSQKANLRKDLESWRGKAFTTTELRGFDVESLIGVNCMLSVIHSETGKAKISGISKLMNGLTPMEPENKRSKPDWIKRFQSQHIENPYLDSGTIEVTSGPDEGDGPPF